MIDELEAIRETSTPADFAVKASKGRWHSAPHLEAINRELVAIARGENDRLIVQMPPRHGKSMLISQYGAAWFRMTFPEWNIMLAGATANLAQRFSTRSRTLVEQWSSHFGLHGLDARTQSWERWKLNGTGMDQGELYASGVGGRGLMGSGCQLLLVDDYHGTVEEALSESFRRRNYEWYLATSSTRVEPGGAIVVIATRWHNDDLIGRLVNDEETGGDRWRVVNMPAINEDNKALWPTRWPLKRLEDRRAKYYADGYGWMWEALYQQEPPELLDVEWPTEYFENIGFDQWPQDTTCKVQAVDPALGGSDKSDFTAWIQLALTPDGMYYVDANIDRCDLVQTVDTGMAMAREFRPDVVAFEKNGFAALGELFNERGGREFETAYEWQSQEKIGRIKIRLTSLLAGRKLRFKNNSPGVRLLIEQLRGFPSMKYKDGPDALATAVKIATTMADGHNRVMSYPGRLVT